MAIVMEKILTNTDVNHRLSFETGSLSHFHFNNGAHFIDFMVVDLTDGGVRELRLYKRQDGHPKPVISKGWMDYVHSKGLRKGDKVILRVNYDGTFTIQSQRTNMRFHGEPLWNDI
ncbi:hypothetical protein ACFE04_023970 [Oxalis oulophora]